MPDVTENLEEDAVPSLVVAVSSQGNWYAYTDTNQPRRQICIRRLDTNQRTDVFELSLAHWQLTMTASPDGRHLALAFASEGGSYILTYDLVRKQQSSQRIGWWDLVETDSLAWDAASRRLAVGMENGTIMLFDALTLQQDGLLVGHRAPARSTAFSPDGNRIATCASDGTVRIWDAAEGNQLVVLRPPGNPSMDSVDWSPDGGQLAAGAATGEIYLFDARTSLTDSAPSTNRGDFGRRQIRDADSVDKQGDGVD